MTTIDDLRSIIAKMRYVKTGDILLADDHNLLVDFAKGATDVLAGHEARIADLESRVETLEDKIAQLQVGAPAAGPFTSTIALMDAILMVASLFDHTSLRVVGSVTRFPPECRRVGIDNVDVVRRLVDAVVQLAKSKNTRIYHFIDVESVSFSTSRGVLTMTLPVTTDAVSLIKALSDAYEDFNVNVRTRFSIEMYGGGWTSSWSVLIDLIVNFHADGTAEVSIIEVDTGNTWTVQFDPSTEHIMSVAVRDFDGDGSYEIKFFMLKPDGTIIANIDIATGLAWPFSGFNIVDVGCGAACDPSSQSLHVEIPTIDKIAAANV